MPKVIKNALIGFGVAFALAFGLSFLATIGGSPTQSSIPVAAAMGVVVFFILQMRSGNRNEVRGDDAAREVALQGPVPPGRAALYIYREGFAGKAVGFDVSLDGAPLAQLRSPRFTWTTVAPGTHKLSVGMNGGMSSQYKPTDLTIEAKAGDTLVYMIQTKMGALSTTLLLVPEPDPRGALSKLARIPMVTTESPTVSSAA